MSRSVVLVLTCLGLAVACGGVEPRAAAPSPPPSPSGRAAPADAGVDAPAKDSPDAAPSPAVRLEPVALGQVEHAPHVEILFPFAEQRILIPKAASYVVRLSVEGTSLEGGRPKVELSLDGERPRPVRDPNATKLAELTPEAAPPKPGAHWLFAAIVDESGSIVRGNGASRAPFAAVRFWVGERPSPPPAPEPRVVLWRPHGTINGAPSADAARVDFLAAPQRLGAGGALVHLVGAGVDVSRRLARWEPLEVEGLPSGDYQVSVALLDEQGKPLEKEGASASRAITVNRDVDVGEP